MIKEGLLLLLAFTIMSCTENISGKQQQSLNALEDRYVKLYNQKADDYLFRTGINAYSKGQRKADMEILKEAEWFRDIPDTVFCNKNIIYKLKNILGRSLSDSIVNNCNDELLKSIVRERFLDGCVERSGVVFCGLYKYKVQLFRETADNEIFKIGLTRVEFRDNNTEELKWIERKIENSKRWESIIKKSFDEY